ncbi:hypothetical protein BD626DRAFT_537230 [Schizophyllum amplum]|uniref:F-box domain-containing protein n=1 Tax=Schizophyllum amplum TaxID=97359 RepID=A0A550CDB2_9AGAR|nr:hypothetical protein BD626DRAFT_537230 [Auriculariopsis ampla]
MVNHPGCTFTRHVREILLGRPLVTDDSPLEPLDWLRRLPNITTLKLTGYPVLPGAMTEIPDIEPRLGRLPCLTTLSLHGITFVTLAAFISMLSMLPDLLDLNLQNVCINDTRIENKVSTVLRIPTDILSKLGRLHLCLLENSSDALVLLLPTLLSAKLVRYPPITEVHLQLPRSEAEVTLHLCELLRRISSRLTTIRIRIGQHDVDAAELGRLEFAQFAQLRSFTVELLRTTLWLGDEWEDGLNPRNIGILLAALQAPTLHTLTIHLLVLDAPHGPGTHMSWESLDRCLDILPLLKDVRLIIHAPALDLDTATNRICELLPRAVSRGILRFGSG